MKDIKSNGFHDIIVQAIEEMKMVLLMCPRFTGRKIPADHPDGLHSHSG